MSTRTRNRVGSIAVSAIVSGRISGDGTAVGPFEPRGGVWCSLPASLLLDIAVARAGVYLEAHGLEREATRLKSRLPKRWSRGTSTDDESTAQPEVPVPQPGVAQPIVVQPVVPAPVAGPFVTPPSMLNGHVAGSVEAPVM